MDDTEVLRSFLEDKTWLLRAQRYSGIDEEEFSDLLGAFFADRSFEGALDSTPRLGQGALHERACCRATFGHLRSEL